MKDYFTLGTGFSNQKLGRIDRLATLHIAQPLQRWMAPFRASHIPILMYHSVSELESGGRHPYFETTTPPRVFAEHMRFLKNAGYRTITLHEAVNEIQLDKRTHVPRVVITFDDGLQDFYTHAFPILKEYNFSATVFLATSYITEKRRQFKKWPCMTWSEVREIHERGMTLGSHTVTHRQLRGLEPAQLEAEVRGSKETIEDHLGHKVEAFSYPFAFPQSDQAFRSILRALLMAHGYKIGVTTIIGTFKAHNDIIFLPRLPINFWDDHHLFQAKLAGDYDWLYGAQYITSRIKSWISKRRATERFNLD